MYDEPGQTEPAAPLLEGVGERAARSLATRFGRRSFLGSVFAGSAALAAGGAATLTAPEVAEGHSSVPCPGNSVTCVNYWGYNDCPPNTCGCGWWDVCDRDRCGGSGGGMRWSDCCWSAGSCTEQCIGGVPSCYNHKIYSQGCGTLNASHIKCRRWYCYGNC